MKFISANKLNIHISKFRVNTEANIGIKTSQCYFQYFQFRSITDADVLRGIKKPSTNLKTLDRTSKYDSNAELIIHYVKNGNYDMVKRITSDYNVNINSHDFGENTPLTDAAKRGDEKGIKFLVEEMGANVHASCDCPHHKTALHYAAENGHDKVVEQLLKYGTNPNVLDSRRYTALDVAKTENIKNILITHGTVPGNKIPHGQTQQLNLPKANCPSLKGRS